LKNGQSNGNLEIDASLAAISNNGTGGLINVGSQINTLSIVGGRIQNQIKNIGATTRNVFFDRRFAQNKFAPLWFPSTTVQTSSSNSATLTTTIQRTNWLTGRRTDEFSSKGGAIERPLRCRSFLLWLWDLRGAPAADCRPPRKADAT
jgi:hypothetical protein